MEDIIFIVIMTMIVTVTVTLFINSMIQAYKENKKWEKKILDSRFDTMDLRITNMGSQLDELFRQNREKK